MLQTKERNEILGSFSKLFNYPQGDLKEIAQGMLDALTEWNTDAAESLRHFIVTIDSMDQSRQEENYTTTFDVNPSCCPFLGNQLFGETIKRSEFLSMLIGKYNEYEFQNETTELADHVMVVLEFLRQLDLKENLYMEILEDGLLPVFEKMKTGFKKGSKIEDRNPYFYLIESCSYFLNEIKNQINGGMR